MSKNAARMGSWYLKNRIFSPEHYRTCLSDMNVLCLKTWHRQTCLKWQQFFAEIKRWKGTMSVVLGLQSTWGAAPATQFLPYAHARPSIGSGGFFFHERGQKIAHFKTRLLLSFSFAAAAYLLALKYSEWPRPRLDAWGVVASCGHSKPKFQAQAHKHILVPHILFLPPRCGGNSIVLLPLPCSYGGARKKEEYWEEQREAEELKSSFICLFSVCSALLSPNLLAISSSENKWIVILREVTHPGSGHCKVCNALAQSFFAHWRKPTFSSFLMTYKRYYCMSHRTLQGWVNWGPSKCSEIIVVLRGCVDRR